MPTSISIVTPVFNARPEWLIEAHRSLTAQQMDWEWVIQFDGPPLSLPAVILDDPRVNVDANGHHSGIAVTRNLALARSQAALVLIMDADDMLAEGALAALVDALADGKHGWAAGAHLRLTDDGAAVPGHGLEPGTIEPGGMVRRWVARNRRWPHWAGSVCYRRESLLAEGGFVAVSHSEDIATLALFSERYSGVILDHVTTIHRVYPTSASTLMDGQRARGSYTLLLEVLAARGVRLPPWT